MWRGLPSGRPYYETAQICLDGHIISSAIGLHPEEAQKHCTKCGKPTITNCQACGAPIRGDYIVPGVAFPPSSELPFYCHECGEPYPWTKATLEAAKELVQMENIPEEEKKALVEDLPALLSDTPRSKVAIARWKRFLDNTGPTIKQAVRDLLVDIVSEAVKKAMFQ